MWIQTGRCPAPDSLIHPDLDRWDRRPPPTIILYGPIQRQGWTPIYLATKIFLARHFIKQMMCTEKIGERERERERMCRSVQWLVIEVDLLGLATYRPICTDACLLALREAPRGLPGCRCRSVRPSMAARQAEEQHKTPHHLDLVVVSLEAPPPLGRSRRETKG
jgi:hypothetical protein